MVWKIEELDNSRSMPAGGPEALILWPMRPMMSPITTPNKSPKAALVAKNKKKQKQNSRLLMFRYGAVGPRPMTSGLFMFEDV